MFTAAPSAHFPVQETVDIEGVGILAPLLQNNFERLDDVFGSLGISGNGENGSWKTLWALSNFSIGYSNAKLVHPFQSLTEYRGTDLVYILPCTEHGTHDPDLPADVRALADSAFSTFFADIRQNCMRTRGYSTSHNVFLGRFGAKCCLVHLSITETRSFFSVVDIIVKSMEFSVEKYGSAVSFVLPLDYIARYVHPPGLVDEAALMKGIIEELHRLGNESVGNRLIFVSSDAKEYIKCQREAYDMMAEFVAEDGLNLGIDCEDFDDSISSVLDLVGNAGSFCAPVQGCSEQLTIQLSVANREIRDAAVERFGVLRNELLSYRYIPIDGPFSLVSAPNRSWATRYSVSADFIHAESTHYFRLRGSSAALDAACSSPALLKWRRSCRDAHAIAQDSRYGYLTESGEAIPLPENVNIAIECIRSHRAQDVKVRIGDGLLSITRNEIAFKSPQESWILSIVPDPNLETESVSNEMNAGSSRKAPSASTGSESSSARSPCSNNDMFSSKPIHMSISRFCRERRNLRRLIETLKRSYGSSLVVELMDRFLSVTNFRPQDRPGILRDIECFFGNIVNKLFTIEGPGILEPLLADNFQVLRDSLGCMQVSGWQEYASWGVNYALSNISAQGVSGELVYPFDPMEDYQSQNLVYLLPCNADGAHFPPLPQPFPMLAERAFADGDREAKKQLLKSNGFCVSRVQIRNRYKARRIAHIDASTPAFHKDGAIAVIVEVIRSISERYGSQDFVIPDFLTKRSRLDWSQVVVEVLRKMSRDCGNLIFVACDPGDYLAAQKAAYNLAADCLAEQESGLRLREPEGCEDGMLESEQVMEILARPGRSVKACQGRNEKLSLRLFTRNASIMQVALKKLKSIEVERCRRTHSIRLTGPFPLFWAPNQSWAIRHSVSFEIVESNTPRSCLLRLCGSAEALDSAASSPHLVKWLRVCRESEDHLPTCRYSYFADSGAIQPLPAPVRVTLQQLESKAAEDVRISIGNARLIIGRDVMTYTSPRGTWSLAVFPDEPAKNFPEEAEEEPLVLGAEIDPDADEGFHSPRSGSAQSLREEHDVFRGELVNREALEVRSVDPSPNIQGFVDMKTEFDMLGGMSLFLPWLWPIHDFAMDRVFTLPAVRRVILYDSYLKASKYSPVVVRCEVLCQLGESLGGSAKIALKLPDYNSNLGNVVIEDPRFLLPDFVIMMKQDG